MFKLFGFAFDEDEVRATCIVYDTTLQLSVALHSKGKCSIDVVRATSYHALATADSRCASKLFLAHVSCAV